MIENRLLQFRNILSHALRVNGRKSNFELVGCEHDLLEL